MNVKIAACAKELQSNRSNPDGPLCTGIRVETDWYQIEGDHRNLYNKVADLILDKTKRTAKFAQPQQPPAPAQQPPPPPPRQAESNGHGHTPKWATRDDAVAAYVFYATRVEEYIKEPYAIVKAANCLMMMEKDGEINPVHKPEEKEPFKGVSNG